MPELTKSIIEDWVKGTAGWFSTESLKKDLNIQSSAAKSTLRVVLFRLCSEGILKRHTSKNGVYCLIAQEMEEIDPYAINPEPISVSWPFGLERYVEMYPQSLVVIAGDKSSGKTAFCYNFVLDNMDHPLGVDLYCSGEGVHSIRRKFDLLKEGLPQPLPFKIYRRLSNFGDVVQPNRISVIDYLDLNSEVYLIGDEIDRIWEKLRGGMVIISIQKKPGQKLGTGGIFSWKRASLYLSMSKGRIEVLDAKDWVDDSVNPTNLKWSFFLEKGVKFSAPKRIEAPIEYE